MGSPTLHIQLLGGVELRLDGVALLPLDSARAESLLAYLLLHRDAPQSRQHLAFLLWPDSPESQARTNLRHVLHNLRRALPDPDRFLTVTARTLQWRADASYWLDVAAFAETVAQAGRAPADDLTALREAVALYAGDLLPGCYDEWLHDERERLRHRYLEALARLSALLAAHRDHADALVYAERLQREDPLDERTYRLLMRLHDARGNRARALQVYHRCAATLERELGVEPSSLTREAYEALLPAERDAEATARPPSAIGSVPLVGRAAEWTHLTRLWRTSEQGRAQLVLVSGEPGIGKTRLVEELRLWCAHRGAVAIEARSYPAEGELAYGPLVAWLRSDTMQARITRLDRPCQTELARLLPELRAAATDLPPPEPLSESEYRLRLFDAIAQALLGSGGPLLLVAEDLHWCDQQSLQFLHYLLRAKPDARLLVAATARREEIDRRHPLHDLLSGLQLLDRCTEIPLGRLTPDETALLATRASGWPLAREAADQIYGETEGNPLFIVETLRGGWPSTGAVRQGLPAKVQAVIESRLAQLSDQAQDLAGIAATVGRAFTPDVLADATGSNEAALLRALDELWRRRIIREQGAHAYDFSHDKIREVAYLALSPATQRHHHAAVARGLERLSAADLDAVASQIAAHWERAGQLDQAIDWRQRAAEAAQKRHMSDDAASLLERALDLLRTLPDSAERSVRELAILTALPGPLAAVEGYTSRRLDDAHRRAIELSGALGIEPAPPLLRSLAVASLTKSDFGGAQQFGQQLRERAIRDADDVLLVESEYVLGIAAFWQGQFAGAREHFETAVDRYGPHFRRAHLLLYGLDPKVICLSRLANTLWFLGYAAAATRARDVALAFAADLGHPYSQATALVFAALLAVDMRDPDRMREYAALLAAQRGEHAAPQTWIPAEAISGFLDVVDGRAEGIARIQRTLDHSRGVEHAPGIRACMARWLLEACVVSGEHRLGLAAADEALVRDAPTPWEAEVRRLRAEFLAALDAPWPEVAAELDRALQVARRQGARSLELRTAISILRQRQRRGDEPAVQKARDALRPLLQTFPTVEHTAEHREAQALLA